MKGLAITLAMLVGAIVFCFADTASAQNCYYGGGVVVGRPAVSFGYSSQNFGIGVGNFGYQPIYNNYRPAYYGGGINRGYYNSGFNRGYGGYNRGYGGRGRSGVSIRIGF